MITNSVASAGRLMIALQVHVLIAAQSSREILKGTEKVPMALSSNRFRMQDPHSCDAGFESP
jgi:hypothetical protein